MDNEEKNANISLSSAEEVYVTLGHEFREAKAGRVVLYMAVVRPMASPPCAAGHTLTKRS